jgi:pimeloyl-ACP methyl ester carboxylesterase
MRETSGHLARDEGERLAWRKVEGRGPTVVWMGGFRSDMTGAKAQALAEWADRTGRAYLRFDYFGHGESTGDFRQGTITRWRLDALAALDALAPGAVVPVGSSMGGWIACLAALAQPERISGLVLVAPAADFTERLIRPTLSEAARMALDRDGVWLEPSEYGEPNPITAALLEDGARWSILGEPVPVTAPVRILQGGQDDAVPWAHALELAQALESRDVVFSLIKDGDHRLSRDQDIARLIAAVEELT